MDLPGVSGPLRQPTAARLFDQIVAARRPLSTAEAADRAGVHPNSARLHLGRLADAGLLEAGSQHGPRGRPRKTWRVAADAQVGGRPPDAYRELAGWLGRSVAVMAADPAEIRGQGRRIGREMAADTDGATGADALEDSLRAMGFWPVREQAGSRTTFRLCNCPYRDVAKSNMNVVCTLHLGIAEGVVQGASDAARVTSFEAKDPEQAGCVIEIDSPAVTESKEIAR